MPDMRAAKGKYADFRPKANESAPQRWLCFLKAVQGRKHWIETGSAGAHLGEPASYKKAWPFGNVH